MSADLVYFFIFTFMAVGGAFGLLGFSRPVYAAFSLLLSMAGVAGLMALMGALFLSVIQITLYAGAVLVLFVMVLMLLDQKRVSSDLTQNPLVTIIKVAVVGCGLGASLGILSFGSNILGFERNWSFPNSEVYRLAMVLFGRYLWLFVLMGFFLLVVAVASVLLARHKKRSMELRS